MEKVTVIGACKTPCKTCPFRKDLPQSFKGWLGEERMQQIVDDCVNGDTYFQCHKDNSLLCAGAIILDEKNNNGQGFTNRSTRMAVAIGWVEPDKMKGKDVVFDNEEDLIEFHK